MEPYNVKIRSEDSPVVLPISTTISSYGASYFASHVLPIVLTLSPKPPPGALVKVKGGLVGESALLLSGIELDGVRGVQIARYSANKGQQGGEGWGRKRSERGRDC